MPRLDRKYRIEYTVYGKQTVKSCIEYLTNIVGVDGNMQAALHFEEEIKTINERLKSGAESYAYLENLELREKEFRKAHFRKMHYKVIFHVIDDVVFVDAVFHDSQDYEGILMQIN